MSTNYKEFDMQLKIDTLRLWRSYSIGTKKFKNLISRFGNASEVVKFLKNHNDIQIFDQKFYQNMLYSEDAVKKEINDVYTFGAEIISIFDDIYINSKYLSENISNEYSLNYPCILTVKGNKDLLHRNSVAIIGSRNASSIGKQWTEKFANQIKDKFVIVSGMARGIDTAAHVNTDNTIAVLACGINKIYPLQNESLYHSISKNGLIVSEFAFNEEPQQSYFLRRNNTIAALSWGVIVVEASLKSGSLVTADAALNQGKEVFAVPNHPFDLRSQGSNMLLKNGAHLIENANDFLSIYSQIAERKLDSNYIKVKQTMQNGDLFQNIATLSKNNNEFAINSSNYDENQKTILDCLSHIPMSIDELLEETKLSLDEISTALFYLEIDHLIDRDLNGKIFLKL